MKTWRYYPDFAAKFCAPKMARKMTLAYDILKMYEKIVMFLKLLSRNFSFFGRVIIHQ